MFERFTDRARRVIVVAQDTARDMSHPQIAPEHLLCALKQGEGIAAIAMAQAGVDGAALRQRVADSIERKPAARELDKIPFSPQGKKALELSLREALALGHNYIGTEHLFLGVEREAGGRGQTLDGLLGVRTADVHQRLLAMLGGATATPPLRSPALQSALDQARQHAGQTPLTTGHVVAALMDDSESQAAQALSALGVTRESLQAALARVPVTGTSDASTAAQSVKITIGESTTVIGDAAIAAALQELSADDLRDAIKRAMGLGGRDQATG
jgi:ATP-dependent Clp protease ATP-binding subunit ClpA